ncbi:hypothetical protein [Streptomyces varsoviensis]|uniref:Lipoprotein n=1 Tax=Streptomyces varsoviensis TaxID=67373 RepID=A0ABR5J7B4_9ACTN|nr:hypothetical protein [Streptomyces varsoviensis]KOG89342.1 hypothetical protein ADK38_14850 [Streptomyces varsoviensis]
MTISGPEGLSDVCAAFYLANPTDTAPAQDAELGKAFFLTTKNTAYIRSLKNTASPTWDSSHYGPKDRPIKTLWVGYGDYLAPSKTTLAAIVKKDLPYFIQSSTTGRTVLAPNKNAKPYDPQDEKNKNAWYRLQPRPDQPLSGLLPDLPAAAQQFTAATALVEPSRALAVVFDGNKYWLTDTDTGTSSLSADPKTLTVDVRAAVAIDSKTILLLDAAHTWYTVTPHAEEDEQTGAIDWDTFQLKNS